MELKDHREMLIIERRLLLLNKYHPLKIQKYDEVREWRLQDVKDLDHFINELINLREEFTTIDKTEK